MSQQLFIKRPRVITTFAIPTVLGYTKKKPIDAVNLVKHGETLNPNYYSRNSERVLEIGSDAIYKEYMDKLFSNDNLDAQLTVCVGENIYKPWDCLSGIFQIEITQSLGLVARPSGVSLNNETIIMTDDYYKEFTPENEKQIESKLMATMAVWKAKYGIYVLKSGALKKIEFDYSNWQQIHAKLQKWAQKFEL
jgi:hypothetical protein